MFENGTGIRFIQLLNAIHSKTHPPEAPEQNRTRTAEDNHCLDAMTLEAIPQKAVGPTGSETGVKP